MERYIAFFLITLKIIRHAAALLATLYINYHIILVLLRINRSIYTTDSSVRSIESWLSSRWTNFIPSINLMILKQTSTNVNLSRNRVCLSPTLRKSTRTVTKKKRQKKREEKSTEFITENRNVPKSTSVTGKGSRGDRISHELMELAELEDSRIEALDFRSPVCQVEHHPDRAELSHASTFPLLRNLPSSSLVPISFRFSPTTHPFLSSVSSLFLFSALLSALVPSVVLSLCGMLWDSPPEVMPPFPFPRFPAERHSSCNVTTTRTADSLWRGSATLLRFFASRLGISAAAARR